MFDSSWVAIGYIDRQFTVAEGPRVSAADWDPPAFASFRFSRSFSFGL